MRSEYYKLIHENGLADILSEICNISYSSKEKILFSLLENYPSQIINMALNKYKIRYIDLNRVDLFKLKNTLIYFCEQFKKNE